MRKCIILLSGLLFFLSSCMNVMILKENEEFVVSEITKYTSINDIISSWTFFYDEKGNKLKSNYTAGNYQMVLDGYKYDDNYNNIEYFQDNPYILYKMYYDTEQKITRKEKYKKGDEIPTFYSIYLYDMKGLLSVEYNYRMIDKKKVLITDIRYHFDVNNKLYKERTYSFVDKPGTYRYYTYDKKGRIARIDFAAKWFNNYNSYDLYKYDKFDRLILIKHYHKNEYIGKTVYIYKKIKKT